jgi:hypothetical protein
MGGVVMAPTAINATRSCAMLAVGAASSAASDVNRTTPAAARRLPMAPVTEFIVTPSLILGVTVRTKLLRRG